MSYKRLNLCGLALCLVMAACTAEQPKSLSYSISRSTVQHHLAESEAAIQKGDWQTAYDLMWPALLSDDPKLHDQAMELANNNPQIGQAAFDNFSKESLRKAADTYGVGALTQEQVKLSVFQRTLATPEQYAQARANYEDVYGVEIPFSEEEARVATLGAQRSVIKGNTQELLETLSVGHTTLKQAIALLGRPDDQFESFTILTWPLRIEGDNYEVLPSFIRSDEGVTHSLVLVFDQTGILTDMSLVRIVK
jgi:hypothetical protein